MPDLGITVASVEVVPYAASPTLEFKLRVENADAAEHIHTVVLRCQIQIEVARRRYTAEEQARLRDLFGEPERWGQTLKNLLWTNASAVAPQFTGVTTVDLQVPCTFDFSVATTKYFNGLEDGEIPVLLMFSGTVFYAGEDGALCVAPISWDKETKFRVPLKVWKDMMDAYYPNIAWLCLRRDVFEELHRYKVERGIPSWEQVFETLLAGSGGAAMNMSTVEKIANAVLYEGYMLYPYRASAVKNQQRFNFGVLYPREYGEAEMITECLVHGSASTMVEVKVRFLQMEKVKDWQEGREREVNIPPSGLSPGNRYDPLHNCRGSIGSVVAQPDSHGGDKIQAASAIAEPVRQRFTFEASETIDGELELRASQVEDDLFRVTLIIRNLTGMGDASREQVLLRSMVSVHSILHCQGGEFVSLLDPPERFKAAAGGCQNIGAWPVLVGDEGQRDRMLAAPIILYDYPQIAPESPGDLCDGLEIDEILALRILTMTDAEKEEVRNGDERARQILERTEMLPPEHFQKLHGALRGLK